MMSEWKEYKLKNLCTKIGSGATPRGGGESYKEYGISLIRSQNVLDLKFSYGGLAFIDHIQADELKNVLVQENDILLNITGDSVARVCKVPEKVLPARVNQHVAIIRSDSSKLDFHFLLYYLQSIKDHLLSISEIGATRRAITKGMIEDLGIISPPLPEQTAIATVLSSLDDKIDLLHRQNATLEKMAETLFRQWFVERESLNYDSSDLYDEYDLKNQGNQKNHKNHSSDNVEEAKEEWVDGTLDDILTVKGGTTPSTAEPAYWNGTIHWTSPRDITNLNGIYLFDTERKITELGLSRISSGLLPKGTLLMSSRAPVGVLAFSEVPVAINQGYIAILDNKGYFKEFIYLWLKINIDIVHSFSNGSTFMEISKSVFKTLQLQIPPKQILNDFQILVKPLFEKIKSNQTQIRSLTALRDTLLPKLMSGEVRVAF